MKRKRMIKLLMSIGFDRDDAIKAANMRDGSISHAEMLRELCEEFVRLVHEMQRQYIIEGDMTGAVAGLIGGADG